MPRKFRSGGRSPLNPWFRVGEFDVTTTVLLIAAGVLSFLIYAIDKMQLLHLYLSADKIQDAVNTDLGIFQEEIQPHTSQIGDPAAEAALSDLLYDSYNVTDFNGVVGSDEFINRMRTFVKAAQDFNRNYCLLF